MASTVQKRPKVSAQAPLTNRGGARNYDTSKATAANQRKAAERRAAGENRRDVRDGKVESMHLAAPKPPPGQTWMLDEVISAYLSQDDAILSREISEAMARKAQAGSVAAAMFLAERSQGKPNQKIQVDANGVTVATLDSLLPEVPGAGQGQ